MTIVGSPNKTTNTPGCDRSANAANNARSSSVSILKSSRASLRRCCNSTAEICWGSGGEAPGARKVCSTPLSKTKQQQQCYNHPLNAGQITFIKKKIKRRRRRKRQQNGAETGPWNILALLDPGGQHCRLAQEQPGRVMQMNGPQCNGQLKNLTVETKCIYKTKCIICNRAE